MRKETLFEALETRMVVEWAIHLHRALIALVVHDEAADKRAGLPHCSELEHAMKILAFRLPGQGS